MANAQCTQPLIDRQSGVKMENQPILEPDEVPLPTIVQMDSLMEFLPTFTAEGFQAGAPAGMEPLGDNTFTFPYWKYHNAVHRFVRTMYEKGVITLFNCLD